MDLIQTTAFKKIHFSFFICNFRFVIEEKALDQLSSMSNLKLQMENEK